MMITNTYCQMPSSLAARRDLGNVHGHAQVTQPRLQRRQAAHEVLALHLHDAVWQVQL